MGPNLLSYTAVLAGQHHLSVRKIQSLLKEQLGTTFSIGAISEIVSNLDSNGQDASRNAQDIASVNDQLITIVNRFKL